VAPTAAVSSEQFQRLMADRSVVCSMSRSGNVWDYAAMENFFSSLKTERPAAKVRGNQPAIESNHQSCTSGDDNS